MGPKTVIRLVILIAIVIVASLSIYFLQRSQVTRMAKSVLEEAQEAEKGGDYEAAIQKYQEHLVVVPGDDVTKAKLADVLLKGGKDFAKQARAAQLYGEILTRNPQRADIRRRLAELSIERSLFKEARSNVKILTCQEATRIERMAICISCSAVARRLTRISRRPRSHTRLPSRTVLPRESRRFSVEPTCSAGRSSRRMRPTGSSTRW